MAVLRTTFPIAASAETVWGILVDFEHWSEWNPSVPSISGDAEVGNTLAMTLAMPGRPSAKVKATITELVPDRRFSWHGNIGGDRFFSGTREFEIDEQPDGTVQVTHVETVTGLLFPVFRAVMGSAIQKHHDNLNAALTARAERADRRAD
jgi:hypothetical protein